jgi:hypothetical protein
LRYGQRSPGGQPALYIARVIRCGDRGLSTVTTVTGVTADRDALSGNGCHPKGYTPCRAECAYTDPFMQRGLYRSEVMPFDDKGFWLRGPAFTGSVPGRMIAGPSPGIAAPTAASCATARR